MCVTDSHDEPEPKLKLAQRLKSVTAPESVKSTNTTWRHHVSQSKSFLPQGYVWSASCRTLRHTIRRHLGVVLTADGTRKVVTFTEPEFDEDLLARLISWLD